MLKSPVFFLFLWLCLSACTVGDEIVQKPQRYLKDVTGNTHVEDYVTESTWNDLFPNRYGMGVHRLPDNHITPTGDFYSFHSFLLAAAKFPKFVGEGSKGVRKRELAAFLANMAIGTNGNISNEQSEYFLWGFYYVKEAGCDSNCNTYADTMNIRYPPVPNVAYYGRGLAQLRGNNNYGAFSEAYFGSKDTLLEHPDLLLSDPVLSFAAAIWLWMTPQNNKPSCHSIMTGKWRPTHNDVDNGRKPGFGAIVNVISGDTECGMAPPDKAEYRYKYYRYFCRILNVVPGKNVECADQKPFGN
jgi:basic endochitinase B